MVHDVYDASMKIFFDNPRAVADLARGFLRADLGGELDFATLEQAPSQFVDGDLRQSRADMVWRVRLRAEDGEVDVFLLLEFQSSVDREMILRVNSYTSALYRKLGRGGATMMPAADRHLRRRAALVGRAWNGGDRSEGPGRHAELPVAAALFSC